MQKDSGRHVQQPSLHRYGPFHSWVDALNGCVQVVPPTHGTASLGLRCRSKLPTKTKRDDRLAFGCKIRQCSNRAMFDRCRCHCFGRGRSWHDSIGPRQRNKHMQRQQWTRRGHHVNVIAVVGAVRTSVVVQHGRAPRGPHCNCVPSSDHIVEMVKTNGQWWCND